MKILLILSTIFVGFLSSAGTAQLSPPALRCYDGVLKNQSIFSASRRFRPDVEIEKLTIGLCTYSDLEGATACYKQADEDPAILAFSKRVSNNQILEKKYARLCSNSVGRGKNAVNGDLDAIDCVKTVASDSRLLTQLKEYSSPASLEDVFTKLCISSNGRGASECILNAYSRKDEILKSARGYISNTTLDNLIIDLCKASRVR